MSAPAQAVGGTAGPWAVDIVNPFETFVRGASNDQGCNYVVAVVHPGHDNATQANARLIAAAPEMAAHEADHADSFELLADILAEENADRWAQEIAVCRMHAEEARTLLAKIGGAS